MNQTSPRVKGARMNKLKLRALLKYFKVVLIKLREKFEKKRQDLWMTDLWIQHHDNASAHNYVIFSGQAHFCARAIFVFAPCDLNLSPKVKNALKGIDFQWKR